MNVIDKVGNNRSTLFFYASLLVYAAVMIYLCAALNIWMDEAYTLDTTSAKYNFAGVIHQSYFFESQPPGYFILLWLWRKISDGVFFARFFSLINIGFAAWYFFKLIKQFNTIAVAQWLTVIFLLNPFVVFIGLEIRLYAFLIFLSAAAIYHYLKYYQYNSKKDLLIFLSICLLCMYTQYFFAFLIAGILLATWIFSSFKKAFITSLYIVPVVLLFLPNIFLMDDQLGMVQTQKLTMSVPQRIYAVLHSPQNLLLSVENLTIAHWARQLTVLLFAGLLIYAYATAYKKNKTNYSAFFKTINFLLVAAAGAILLMAVLIAVTGIDHVDRYLTIVMPVLILSYGLVSALHKKIATILFAAFAVYLTLLFAYTYAQPVKQFDYKNAAAYIDAEEKNNEPLFFYHSTVALPFRYYYKGSNRTLPVPHEVPFDNTYMENVKDTAALKQCMESNRNSSPSFLFISDLAEKKYANDSNRIMVNNYLNINYTLQLDTLFYGNSKTRPLRIRRYLYK